MTSLQEWLSTLEADDLAGVLAHRPDVLRWVEPRGLAELADRLSGGTSVAAALQQGPAPVLELIEALLTLGRPSRDALVALLEDAQTEQQHAEHVDRVLGWLRDRAIVHPCDGDTLAYPTVLHDLIPNPLGLGTPARLLLDDVTAANLNKMLTALRLPRQSTKRAALDAMVDALADDDRVRELVASAPPDVGAELARLADARSGEDYYIDPYSPTGWQRRRQATEWATERGLLLQSYWGAPAVLPAEVARALRGPDFRAPFHPLAPVPRTRSLDASAVARESQVAMSAFADRCVSVLDLLARTPVKALSSGGIGTRELARLVKATGFAESEVRLVLALADELGLLSRGTQIGVSETFAQWRSEEPAARFVGFLVAWWRWASTPTQARVEDGKPRPVARRSPPCRGCLQARHGLIAAAAAMAPGTASEPAELMHALLWARPLAHVVAEDGDPAGLAVWLEAEQLGVLAHGALTDVGRALLADDAPALHGLATTALPAATDVATFGSDLTAVVAGQPSARVSATLDAAADRESRGPATVWRFSTASVRRALDDGAEPNTLLEGLESVATAGLPQPLRYLVGDVGRRHGSVRVREAVTVLLGQDPALVAQLAADRSLRSLRLQLVAPTVLLCHLDAEAATTALRKAGYLPVRENDSGMRVLAGAPRPAPVPAARGGGRSPAPRAGAPAASAGGPAAPIPEPVDFAAAAARIRAGDVRDGVPTSRSEALLAQRARRLGPAEVRLLAHALDNDAAVSIEYDAASGGRTVRTISELELFGGMLSAWCHLRVDERQFALERIVSVHPA